MTSEQQAAEPVPGSTAVERPGRSKTGRNVLILIGAILVLNVVALILVPPFPRDGQPGDACAYPVCFINGTLEFPAPHTVWVAGGRAARSTGLITLPRRASPRRWSRCSSSPSRAARGRAVAAPAASRRARPRPELRGVGLRVAERLRDAAWAAPRRAPLHAHLRGFFMLILVFNWSGLLPIVGQRRVPASAHQRPERDHRPGPRGLLHLPGRGLPRAWLRGLPRASSSRSTSSRTASARASSPCSWASWS